MHPGARASPTCGAACAPPAPRSSTQRTAPERRRWCWPRQCPSPGQGGRGAERLARYQTNLLERTWMELRVRCRPCEGRRGRSTVAGPHRTCRGTPSGPSAPQIVRKGQVWASRRGIPCSDARPERTCPYIGGAPCAVPALCGKWAILHPLSPMAKVTSVATVFPDTGLLRFLLSPRTQVMSSTSRCFTLKMPDCCLNLPFLPCGRGFPGGGGWFSGWS